MSKVLVGAALTAVFAIAPAGALATGGHGSDYDSARGAGVIVADSINTFVFGAWSGPSGQNPKGAGLVYDNTLSDGTGKHAFAGPITCLKVLGNRAVMYLDFKFTRNQTGPRVGVLLVVDDNGTGKPSPDRIGIRDQLVKPLGCPDPLTVAPPQGKPTKGDIAVHDAQP